MKLWVNILIAIGIAAVIGAVSYLLIKNHHDGKRSAYFQEQNNIRNQKIQAYQQQLGVSQ